ncbi:MAG: bifunctional adenosylcobinamide kinase/adenosylcobinamide-phosphate guanylyltransferase [Candidatus Obscuribacterales bacterium]|nr:bifunctional adenosylcobinamide kinase/adenosylcobinamide-phosphate guanylyltransferase [Candidatus Obscuribacterales bacterium]
MKNLTLITGGVRSGKSVLAEKLALENKQKVYYLATMPIIAGDKEQEERIRRHQNRRPTNWETIECHSAISKKVMDLPQGPACVLLDCLSLFVTNILLEDEARSGNPYEKEQAIVKATEDLLAAIKTRTDLFFVVVTNEVGWGVVPETSLGRAFRDFLGQTNQIFAQAAEKVILCCSGLSINLKS